MALFDGDVLYNNVKGSLKIMVDGATFIAETSGAVLDLQFLPEPTSSTKWPSMGFLRIVCCPNHIPEGAILYSMIRVAVLKV